MLKTNSLLYIAVFLAIITTIVMFIGFAILPVSRINFIFINFLTIMGYLGSMAYYSLYLERKEKEDYEEI